jgi:hypothetical protein
MIVLLPTSAEQVISVMPRTIPSPYSDNNEVVVTITRDGDGESETISPTLMVDNGYYVDLTISSTILEESSTYKVEIAYYGDLWYRDKLYVTSQADYTIKHQIAQPSYTQYNTIDDNTYIIQ